MVDEGVHDEWAQKIGNSFMKKKHEEKEEEED